ncbi:hypothetical protein DPEC_G00314350 [Dallia pectoralis]|uniref:Uncharacterized protein n=1 Tax=Dallia pectoralis TaxID=75939 RepID=A0ACC2FCE2_DALPE|nr:hypothetical protein DPEC_G00314350 [Dallia pectoralis]
MSNMVSVYIGVFLLAIYSSSPVTGQTNKTTAPTANTDVASTVISSMTTMSGMPGGVTSHMTTIADVNISITINRRTNSPAVTAGATNAVSMTSAVTTTRPVSATATTTRPVSVISNPKAAGVSLQSRSSTVLILLVGSLLHSCC